MAIQPTTSTLLALTLIATLAACGKPKTPAENTVVPAAVMPQAESAPPSQPAAAMGGVASQVTVAFTLISDQGAGAEAGSVSLSDGAEGLMLKTALKGLPPGEHGFHVHQNPDCGPGQKDGKTVAGEAAGEHLDLAATGKHAGPEGAGHNGDMPRLTVAADGTSTVSLLAPSLKLADVKNRALVIHAERDDYAGAPGGARIACGVIR